MEKLCLESGKVGFNERKRDHEARFGKKSGGKQRNLEREKELENTTLEREEWNE